MAKINENIVSELERLVLNCTRKRELLLKSGLAKSSMKKTLTIASGILALFSAGTMTAVIVKYFGNETLQIIATLTAALSGLFSLMLAIYYSENDTTKIFEGSSQYLILRDKTYRLLINPSSTSKKLYEDMANLHTEYGQLDQSFAKYTRIGVFRRLLFFIYRDKEADMKQAVPIPHPYIAKYIAKREKLVRKAVEKESTNFQKEVSTLKEGGNSQ